MKTWKTVGTLLSVLIVGVMVPEVAAQSSFSVTYDFSGVVQNAGGQTDPTPPPTAADLTFGSFTSVGASANPNAGGRFSFTSQPLGGVNLSDDFSQFTGSLDLNVYFEVSITPTPLASIALQLDTISWTIQRSGTGIRSYAVRSSVDGYAANLPASINSPANANLAVGPGNEFQWALDSVTTAQNGSLVTLGLPHANLTTPVTFRFYGWNAEGTGGTFSIDNVTFSGSTRNIPEPTTGALLILGLAAWSSARRRNA
jgi:hypothetical protein